MDDRGAGYRLQIVISLYVDQKPPRVDPARQGLPGTKEGDWLLPPSFLPQHHRRIGARGEHRRYGTRHERQRS